MTTTDELNGYIEEGPRGARLRDSGVEVWALVAQLPAMNGDAGRLADAYGLSRKEVDAALDYYQSHKDRIDAQIIVNVT